jgi:hypothetical protein
VVETQHIAATMKLVDDVAEQDVLEALLDASKPPLPDAAADLHPLLATPFRYDPRRGGSRFRGETDPGVFYGAQGVRTACAELGYWRWRFLRDAVDLTLLEPVAHTAFKVRLSTRVVDLREPPFAPDRHAWMHPSDYAATQSFARAAREGGVGAILYRSVRDPMPAWCVALLTPLGFASSTPDRVTQTWWLAVHQDGVVWRRERQSLIFSAAAWSSSAHTTSDQERFDQRP